MQTLWTAVAPGIFTTIGIRLAAGWTWVRQLLYWFLEVTEER